MCAASTESSRPACQPVASPQLKMGGEGGRREVCGCKPLASALERQRQVDPESKANLVYRASFEIANTTQNTLIKTNKK